MQRSQASTLTMRVPRSSDQARSSACCAMSAASAGSGTSRWTNAWRLATSSAESSHEVLRLEVERTDRCAPRDAVLAGELPASANMPAMMGPIRLGKLPSHGAAT